MTEYRYTSKCRRCGERYRNGVVTGNKNLAVQSLIHAMMDLPTQGAQLATWDIHQCEDGGMGIGDLTGVDVIGDTTTDQQAKG